MRDEDRCRRRAAPRVPANRRRRAPTGT
jgi:hypothetical protein